MNFETEPPAVEKVPEPAPVSEAEPVVAAPAPEAEPPAPKAAEDGLKIDIEIQPDLPAVRFDRDARGRDQQYG